MKYVAAPLVLFPLLCGAGTPPVGKELDGPGARAFQESCLAAGGVPSLGGSYRPDGRVDARCLTPREYAEAVAKSIPYGRAG